MWPVPVKAFVGLKKTCQTGAPAIRKEQEVKKRGRAGALYYEKQSYMSDVIATITGTTIPTVALKGDKGNIVAGGHGQDGSLILKDKSDESRIIILGSAFDPEEFAEMAGPYTILMDGRSSTLKFRADRKEGIHLDGTTSAIRLRGADGKESISIQGKGGNLYLGGNRDDGDLVLYPSNVDNGAPLEKAAIHLAAGNSTIYLRANGQTSIRLEGEDGNLRLGGNSIDGDLVLYPSSVGMGAPFEMSAIHLSARDSAISLRGPGQESIRIDGKIGDIALANADGAEEFEIDEEVGPVEPGCVLVISDESRLRLADRPYDRRVAGIVSGAGGLRPGIVLGRSRGGRRVPVALFGKVNCKVDATEIPVLAGDLLTTSQTLGYAMRAEPDERASGALIGKALRGLEAGRDLIPVLVSLH
jgi:hypothetical protein